MTHTFCHHQGLIKRQYVLMLTFIYKDYYHTMGYGCDAGGSEGVSQVTFTCWPIQVSPVISTLTAVMRYQVKGSTPLVLARTALFSETENDSILSLSPWQSHCHTVVQVTPCTAAVCIKNWFPSDSKFVCRALTCDIRGRSCHKIKTKIININKLYTS